MVFGRALIEAATGDQRAWAREAFTDCTYDFAIGSYVGFVESLQFLTDLLNTTHCWPPKNDRFHVMLAEVGRAPGYWLISEWTSAAEVTHGESGDCRFPHFGFINGSAIGKSAQDRSLSSIMANG
jgi:hypothetical protein